MLACTLGIAASSTASSAAERRPKPPVLRTTANAHAHAAALRWLRGQIVGYQRATWHWEHLMGRRLTHTEGRTLAAMSIPDVQRAVALWKRRANTARRRAQHPPHLAAWLCIHRFEASWTDPGAPYYGGLQMDLGFQARYGGRLLRTKGTANHWTPIEQIWVAERARRSGRGFYPWPNTARYCGLL